VENLALNLNYELISIIPVIVECVARRLSACLA
jgi:hypothetical protein